MKKLRALVFAKRNDLSRVIEPRELRFLLKPTGKKQLDKMMSKPKSLKN